MFFAMVAGMIMGMVVLTVIVLIFGPICSIFQLLPSGMIITKLTGMATGMMFAMADVNFAMVFFVIVIFSLFVQFVIDLYNMKLKGDVIVDE